MRRKLTRTMSAILHPYKPSLISCTLRINSGKVTKRGKWTAMFLTSKTSWMRCKLKRMSSYGLLKECNKISHVLLPCAVVVVSANTKFECTHVRSARQNLLALVGHSLQAEREHELLDE